MNKVSINICGQDYVITGEKSAEHIAKVGAYVDRKMREIAEGIKGKPLSAIAVLAAVNAADEYFTLIDDIEEMKRSNEQLESQSNHYVQLWEEAKKSFVEYKEDVQAELKALKQQKDATVGQLHDKDKEIEAMLRNQKAMEAEMQKGSDKAVKEMEAKYKDLENNFFDLQMENIQLKSELEKVKSQLEWKKGE
ncbi:MAG: cell division protein ZapA [Anaerovoracaceae bacterium]